ncbi:MAG: YfiR family protein [Bacteroidota bacterium]|nr:YfiR family protein [Bacteroidota bacterium]
MRKIKISVLLLLFTTIAVYGQKERFEAIYIYNFTKKIEWPKEANTGDFIIGILGDSKIVPELKKVANAKKVGSRAIKVKEFSDVPEIENCHILFVVPDESTKLSAAQKKLVNNPTLFVTDKKGMAKSGSAINFIEKNGKLKFELNKSNATKKGLKVSTDLEKLAIIVN